MPRTRTFTLLPMDLPSARISVDFTNFTPSQPLVVPPPQPSFYFPDFQFRDGIVTSQPPANVSTLQHSGQSLRSEPNKSPHHRNFSRRTAADNSPLPEISEDRPTTRNGSARAHPRRRWAITPSMPNQPNSEMSQLSRVTSNASAASYVSSNDSFVFSRTQSSTSTAYTSYSSQQSLQNIPEWNSPKREPKNLTSLPSHLIEKILFEALYLPSRVSIGPPSSKDQHQRAGIDCINLQFIRGQPIFSVSRQIRDVALHVFHDRCDFVIYLHSIYHTRTSSKVRDNLKKYRNFWLGQGPPEIVKDTLRTLTKLSLRLPAASYSSDGQGASHKKESEDATKIEKILEAITSFIWPSADDTGDMGRGSSNEGRNESLRKKSFSHIRNKSREFLYRDSESPRPASREQSGSGMRGTNEKRQSLKSFEVVLVKRNPNVTVMPETLNYIKLLRQAQVSGFTDYFLQLEEQKVPFATKYGKKWQGIEPDPDRLLEGK